MTTAREYLRVSKDQDGLSRSTVEQHEENALAVAAQGWSLHPDPYVDDGISASRFAKRARAGFAELLADLKSGSFDADVLVLWESSRGSRKVSEWAYLIEVCEEQQIKVFITTHGRVYDPTNARDRRSLQEDAVDAEYESAKSSTRILRNVQARAQAGSVHGKNIYGYRRVYDDQTRRLLRIEPDPEQAPIVQEAARRVLAGESQYQVAKDFNQRGIPPRRKPRKEHRKHFGWTPVAVRQMLEMPAYAGLRTHRGEIVAEAQWPALIDRRDWDQLQELFKKRGRPSRERDWSVKHLMAGLAVCGVCGAPMRVGKQNLGRKKDGEERRTYYTYQCQGVPGRTGFHVAIREEHLDTTVSELLIRRLSRPEFLATVGTADQGVDAERQALLDQIDGYRRYLDEVREQAAEALRFDLLLDQEARILPKMQEAQKQLEALAATDPAVIELASASDVRSAWEALSIEGKRRVIRELLRPSVARAKHRGVRGLDAAASRVTPGWR